MLTKIVFDEERRVLVDEDKLEFKGTRISGIVGETGYFRTSRDYAESATISKLEDLGKERYHADAYELISLSSRDESAMEEYGTPNFGVIAWGIFYKRD